MKLILFEVRFRRLARVVRRLTVFLRAFLLRGFLRLLGAALLLTLRRRVVFRLLGDLRRLVVFLRRVFAAFLAEALRLRLFAARVRAAFLAATDRFREVLFLRVVRRLLGDFLLRVVFFLRVTRRLLGLALLRVVLRRRVVFLRLGAALRRVTLLADFLLAIVFLPFLFDFTLLFRLAEVFLFVALRLAFRRGFKITTSAKGMISD